jgi:hypothetical protein
VPASRADRQLLVFTTVLVLVAGLLVAAALFFATGGGDSTPKTKPLFVGLEKQLRKNLREEGPQYIPSPFGGNGFWLDLEGGKLVAYSVVLPGTRDCNVKWKESRKSYVDCDDRLVQPGELDRFLVSYGKGPGNDRRVQVDQRIVEQATGADSGG